MKFCTTDLIEEKQKNHYRDIEDQEQLALYTTADQTPSKIMRVKGEIEDAHRDIQQEESKQEQAI